jgi:hypothetical protein
MPDAGVSSAQGEAASWLLELASAAEDSALAVWLRASAWGYPAVETVHVWGLALLVGTAIAFDLRLLGAGSRLPVDALARLLLPCARTGFAIAAASGVLLFAMQATTFAAQPLFYVKLGAIGVAVVNASIFHRGVFRTIGSWNHSPATPARAKIAALCSLAAWTVALICGRWLAYV